MELLRLLEAARNAGGGDCALATLVEVNGPAYRRPGARLLIRHDQKTWGAISGGCVETDLMLHGLEVIKTGQPVLIHHDAAAEDDLVFGNGTGCGGKITVLIEPLSAKRNAELLQQLSVASGDEALVTVYRETDPAANGTRVISRKMVLASALVQPISPPITLAIFGASPAAEALAHYAKELGWRVRLADHRPAIAADGRFAATDQFIIAPAEQQPAKLVDDSLSAAVVMTHHFLRDVELLKQLLGLKLPYLGVVGSRGRAARLLAELTQFGIAAELLSNLHAPAGLDIGSDSPAEIALSIIAEIQATLRHASGTPLRDRRGPIHETRDETAIIILAAGGSRRLGQPKQLVELDGKPLVRIAAETALAATEGPVQVVIGAQAEAMRQALEGLPVTLVQNEAWAEGMASSIRAGLEAVEKQSPPVENVLVMLCDQPGVTPNLLRRLIAARRGTRAPVIASRYPDGPGVPALFRAELFEALKHLRGDTGAKHLIRQLDREIVTVPFDASADLDTPADLDRLTKKTGRDPVTTSPRL